MKNLQIILATILVFCAFSAQAIAWTDWEAETPGGNSISDNWGPKTLIVQDSFVLQGLKEWYFYESYIIGTYGPDYDENNRSFFIYNEINHQLDTFNLETDWSSAINRNGLQPSIWTRWHSGNWTSISFATIFISIIIVLLLWMILRMLSKHELLQKRKAMVLFGLGVLTLFMVIKCMLNFPQSI
ncbi:hypothetical protein KFE94_08770 [bacterium SCSIO 12643]|nr:hypothetical protein KFE94_08770 [bacterium SCSIO 12643]